MGMGESGTMRVCLWIRNYSNKIKVHFGDILETLGSMAQLRRDVLGEV